MLLTASYAQQNLIKNPSFEQYIHPQPPWWTGTIEDLTFAADFDSLNGTNATISDWMMVGPSPDAYTTLCPWYSQSNLPTGLFRSKYVYPHSGNNCAGDGQYFNSAPNEHELLEGKLTKSLVSGHKYVFSIWLQLIDTIKANWGGFGEIVGINNFDVYFSDTAVAYQGGYFQFSTYTPQVFIHTMVIDTQHWVQIIDTFTCEGFGGAKYFCMGNLKPDGQFQTQLVDSIRGGGPASYYFMDDVSLIDLDTSKANGINDLKTLNKKLEVYPNPATTTLTISLNNSEIKSIEITDLLGRTIIHNNEVAELITHNSSLITIKVEDLINGIYLLKAIDDKGFNHVAKFIKSTN